MSTGYRRGESAEGKPRWGGGEPRRGIAMDKGEDKRFLDHTEGKQRMGRATHPPTKTISKRKTGHVLREYGDAVKVSLVAKRMKLMRRVQRTPGSSHRKNQETRQTTGQTLVISPKPYDEASNILSVSTVSASGRRMLFLGRSKSAIHSRRCL